MAKARGRKPSLDKKRIEDLESRVFSQDKVIAHQCHEIGALRAALACARRHVIDSRLRLFRLQQIVFSPEPTEECQPL